MIFQKTDYNYVHEDKQYLTFRSTSSFSINISSPSWDGLIQYSTDSNNWYAWDGTNISSVKIYDNAYYIFLRGTDNTIISGTDGNGFNITSEGLVYCIGNIENLLDYEDVENNIHPTANDCCFKKLFYNCMNLASPPDMPLQSIPSYGCYSMFAYCTSLRRAPDLPAESVYSSGFCGMFTGCTSLIKAPHTLSGNCLGNYSYSSMFSSCTSLITAPQLTFTSLSPYCCQSMFNGCTSLITGYVPQALTLSNGCYKYMFRQCVSLINAPALPATTLSTRCYEGMFSYCGSLINAPALPSTNFSSASYCYTDMFYDCYALEEPPVLASKYISAHCYERMFKNCVSLRRLTKLPANSLCTACYSSMFEGCSLIKISETMTDECKYKFRIPQNGSLMQGSSNMVSYMFNNTGGAYTRDPNFETVYYVNEVPSIKTVSWSSGTDDQIKDMIENAECGWINLRSYWSVGNTRSVQLSATDADAERGIEAHSAQTVTLVLMDRTCTGFTVNGNTPNFIVGMKDGLKETGVMNTTNTNVGGWEDCTRRSWCNTEFRNSLPSTLRECFKQFEWCTSEGGTSTDLNTVQDYFALPPEKCVYGSVNYAHTEESALYSLWSYYNKKSNRIKKKNGTAHTWFTSSPTTSSTERFYCTVYSDAEPDFQSADTNLLLSPFGCI